MGELLQGRSIAKEINQATRKEIDILRTQRGVTPQLALITAGLGDALKQSEFILHESAAQSLGIEVKAITLGDDATEAELMDAVHRENRNPGTHGILVLLPLPKHIDQEVVFAEIAPEKELEGLLGDEDEEEVFNFDDIDIEGKQGTTITAVRTLLESIDFDIPRSKNVFVTEDDIRNNPLVSRLLRMSERVSVPIAIATTRDPNVRDVTRTADLVLVSVSAPEVIDDTFLKKGAVVVDFLPVMVGERFSEKKNRVVPVLKGGVNVEAALRKASYVAPALGSTGPIIIAMMMRNLILNCQQQLSLGPEGALVGSEA